MKAILYVLLLSLGMSDLQANPFLPFEIIEFQNPNNPTPKPEKIYSFTRVVYPLEYYIQQAKLWEMELATQPQHADAWLNYYQAAHIANVFSESEKPFDLNRIFKDLEKAIPNTFEQHYISYTHNSENSDRYTHLEEAYQLQPNRFETYQGMITHHELQRNTAAVSDFCQKWFNSQEFSPGIMAWNYNALMSLESNAILLTHGDNDTYPVWMLQHAKNVRTDVTIINMQLILQSDYREAIFQENNIPSFPNEAIDFPTLLSYHLAISHHILQHSERPTYLGIASAKEIRQQHDENLYLVGLALKYAEKEFDNIALLKNNFENQFLTDHLKVNFEDDISVSVLNQMNLNYVPALMVLHEYYLKNNQISKADEIEQMNLRIGKAGGKEVPIQKYLQTQTANFRNIESILNTKDLEKGLVQVDAKLWAINTELTNAAYEQFLMDLLKNKEFDLLETCKTTKTDWRALLPIYHQRVTNKVLYAHGHPDDPRTPVQNISYEAAQLYCQWITNVYNNSTSKKKQFKKVKFRLPNEAEWEAAARTGRDTITPYPWGGFYSRNAKGCYLSNFYVSEEMPCETCNNTHPSNDGGFFPVVADAYFPNDYGLYGMSGNVAEMVAEKGIAKGGSWEDVPGNCTIQARKKVEGKSPAVGFRVFMDVIEN